MLKTAENFVRTCLQCTGSRSTTSKLRSLKVLCIKTPAEAQPVLLRGPEVLHHTGRTSAIFGEKFATSSVTLTSESGPVVHCKEYFWWTFAPKFQNNSTVQCLKVTVTCFTRYHHQTLMKLVSLFFFFLAVQFSFAFSLVVLNRVANSPIIQGSVRS